MSETILPPKPMTASILMSYLQFAADDYMVEDQPVMIGDKAVVNATVVNGRVVLQTFEDMLVAGDV